MCIAVWLWQSHPRYPLLLLLNRDESHNRPTSSASWWEWEDSFEVLGGRDCQAGGTWMASTRDGRLAFLTNVREPDRSSCAKSRGSLPLQFLKSGKSPYKFALEVAEEAYQYNGFNLIVADLSSNSMVYVSNRPKGQPVFIQNVPPGLHVLSNAKLDTPWFKAQRLGQNFKNLVNEYGDKEVQEDEMVGRLMRDTVKASREELPHTGHDPEWELMLSSIFVEAETKQGRYGTRSTTAFTVKAMGDVILYESYLENCGWKDHTISYQIQKNTVRNGDQK